MQKYNNLYMFGDSFSTPNMFVKSEDSFWGLSARDLEVDNIVNFSQHHRSFDLIVHHLIQTASTIPDNSLLMIGIPPLERMLCRNEIKTENRICKLNGDCSNLQISIISDSEELKTVSFNESALHVEHYDREWLEVETLKKLLLLETYLSNFKFDFIFINLTSPFSMNDRTLWAKFYVNFFKDTDHILFKNTLYDINLYKNKPIDFDKYGWSGHHGSDGNKFFYEKSLRPILKNRNIL